MPHTRFINFIKLACPLAFLLAACAPPDVIPLPPTRTPLVVTVTPAAPVLAPPTSPGERLLRVRMHAPALSANLLGESDDRILQVYLPPSYYSSQSRYPVIYYLPGFGDQEMLDVSLPNDLDKLIEQGTIKETIIVVVSGVSVLGGSFYVNSPVTGGWDDFVTRDVIGYVDANYRTIPQAVSRGIAGHSTGGFGALRLAMLHPDVFGAVYALSPTLFDPNGLSSSPTFSSQQAIANMVNVRARESILPVEDALLDMKTSPPEIQFLLAYAATFSPDLRNNPPYDYPYHLENGKIVRDDAVWQRWTDGFGGLAVNIPFDQANLQKLNGIALDYGLSDPDVWIPQGCQYFAAQLTLANIPNRVTGYPGDHQSQLGDRIRTVMLPFFSQKLIFGN